MQVFYKLFSDRLEYALCLFSQDDAEQLASAIEASGYLVLTEACPHSVCQRHDGWRLHTDAPWAEVKALLDSLQDEQENA